MRREWTRQGIPLRAGRDRDPKRQVMDVLFQEYHALYLLAGTRIASLERRTPFAGAALVAFLGSVVVLPAPAQLFVLIGLPAALVVFLLSTATHASSFEDLIRRIDEIELQVNELAGAELLVFQSQHPSKGRAVGGRTGLVAVVTIFVISVLLLGASAHLSRSLPELAHPAYVVYLAGVAAALPIVLWRFSTYRYQRRHPA